MPKNRSYIVNALIHLEDLCDYGTERCRDLLHKDLPFNDSMLLIGMFSKVFEQIRNEILLMIEDSENHDDEFLLNLITLQSRRLRELHQYFIYIEPLGRENISQSNLDLLSYLTARVDKSKFRFVFVPSYEFNFSIFDIIERIRKLVPKEEVFMEIVKEGIDKIFLISFPFVYKNNIVANCMISHEIGHFIVDTESSLNFFEEYRIIYNKHVTELRPKFEVLFNELIKDTIFDYTGDTQKGAGFEASYRESARSAFFLLHDKTVWNHIKEIISDVIAFISLGPVYLISMFQVLLSASPFYSHSGSHPPNSLRTKILLDLFENYKDGHVSQEVYSIINSIKSSLEPIMNLEKKFGYDSSSLLEPLIEEQSNILSYLFATKANSVAKFAALVRNEIEMIIEEMLPSITKSKMINSYKAATAKETEKLVETLTNNVPPCEVSAGLPATIPEILNVGIQYKNNVLYKELSDKKTRPAELTEWSLRLDRLILKAVELCTIQMKFKEKMKLEDTNS